MRVLNPPARMQITRLSTALALGLNTAIKPQPSSGVTPAFTASAGFQKPDSNNNPTKPLHRGQTRRKFLFFTRDNLGAMLIVHSPLTTLSSSG
jgi:hypothetical protein